MSKAADFVELLDKHLANETAKSQFAGKLIGLGVLKKTPDGKLVKAKEVDTEEVIGALQTGTAKKLVAKASEA